jgi:23S rRNA (guanosine2251-2'-O)-methyltransferase
MQENNLVGIEGRNAVFEALRSDRDIKNIYIESRAKGDKLEKVFNLAKQRHIPIRTVDKGYLRKMAKTESHQGIIALAQRITTLSSKAFLEEHEKSNSVCVIILRKLDFEHNLGAIIRTAAASGVDAVVIPKGRKGAITETVERVSTGGVNQVKIVEESFYSALKNFKQAGFNLIGLEVSGSNYYFDENLTGLTAFIFGSESETLGEEVTEKLDKVVKIPMLSDLSSLNVSVSAGIVLYERVRQIYEKNSAG